MDVFKQNWLNSIPDEPPASGSKIMRVESNSFAHEVWFQVAEMKKDRHSPSMNQLIGLISLDLTGLI